jgi:dolichyl-phosphate beta-glucosyltransferase
VPEYSIVISAYNEADKISSTLTQITNFMKEFSPEFEIVVVDDGSRDNTAQIVEGYAAENPHVVLVKNPHKGKGVGVWTGITHARGTYIYMCDADLSASIQELKKLSVWTKEQGFDIVIASREGTGALRVSEPAYRHIMGRVFNIFVQVIALPGITDSQCGFKLFKGAAAKDIFSRLRVYTPQSGVLKDAYTGAFDVEVLYLARKLGYKIKQVPVTWSFVKTTRIAPFRDSLKMARDVLRIKLNDLRGFYKS